MTPREFDDMIDSFVVDLREVSSQLAAGRKYDAYNLLMHVADRMMDVPKEAFGIQ